MTLAERKTHYEMIIKIDGQIVKPVNRTLKNLHDAAGKDFALLFQTITSDNGTEISQHLQTFVRGNVCILHSSVRFVETGYK
ncbi:MAG: hypothetical protein ACLR95_20270 [Enterococcus avium]